MTGNNSVNQATLSLQTYQWNPTPLNPTLVGRNYFGLGLIGGNPGAQDFKQRRIELRDDYNFPALKLAGDHQIQVGGNLDFMHYDITKFQNGNPEFDFRQNVVNGKTIDTFDAPFQVVFGFGNPRLKSSNNQYGVHGHDTCNIHLH